MVARGVAAIAVLLLAALPCAAVPERPVVGIWVTDIYDLDPTNRSFTVKCWLWSRTPADARIQPLTAMDLQHVASFDAAPPVVVKEAGTIWTQRYVTAVVRHHWDVRSFPFDRHDLTLIIQDAVNDESNLVYDIDVVQSGIDPHALPSSWLRTGFRVSETRHTFLTSFGDPSLTQARSRWSQVETHIPVQRDAVGVFLKLLIGAYVAFLLALLSFRIHTDQPTLFSTRLALLVGSLFATIVNLRATEAVLGRTDYFTLVDKIHLTIAVYILVAALLTLLSRRHNDHEKPRAAIALDRVSMIAFGASFVAVNILLISRAVLTG